MKHTQGTWKIEDNGVNGYLIRSISAVVVCETWSVGQEYPDIEGLQNARLIAAAPELLEACRVALPLLTDHVSFSHNETEMNALRLVEAAIVSATGGQSCPYCGDDRTGKGSLIVDKQIFCNEECHRLHRGPTD